MSRHRAPATSDRIAPDASGTVGRMHTTLVAAKRQRGIDSALPPTNGGTVSKRRTRDDGGTT